MERAFGCPRGYLDQGGSREGVWNTLAGSRMLNQARRAGAESAWAGESNSLTVRVERTFAEVA